MYYDSSVFVERLWSAYNGNDRPITFLFGSALSLPDRQQSHGVPGVHEMIDLIRDELSATSPDDALDQEITNDPANRYRKAFEYLQATRGHEAVSRVVRTAVWKAIDIAKWPSHIPPSSAANADSNICESIELCVDAWVLPSAVDILGRLLVNHQDRLGRAPHHQLRSPHRNKYIETRWSPLRDRVARRWESRSDPRPGNSYCPSPRLLARF